MTETDVLHMMDVCKHAFHHCMKAIDAGLSTGVAYQTALEEIDREYRRLCASEGVQPKNHMLNGPDVEAWARFGLEYLFGAQAGGCDQSEARKAFWTAFHRCSRPSLSNGGKIAAPTQP